MGGEGSGRKPDVIRKILAEIRTPIASTNSDGLYLPNYSGLKKEALKTDSTNLTGVTTGSGTSGRVTLWSGTQTLTSNSLFTYSSSQLNLNTSGVPTIPQMKIRGNSVGMLSFMTYINDNVSIGFDTDFSSGSWIARDTNAFSISKDSVGLFKIRGNTGLTSGNAYSPATIFTLNTSGNLDILGSYSSGGVTGWTGSLKDSASNTIAEVTGGIITSVYY